jgi:hypothetical protein
VSQPKNLPMYYLNTFRPICWSKQGRIAIKDYQLSPFIDASCRREPDFELSLPSISALCRTTMFAPRLNVGDSVAYMTVKGVYEPIQDPHWRLVAILRVIRRFENHSEAAAWYVEQGLKIPSNCMVEDNEHVPYEMTGGISPKKFGGEVNPDKLVRKWDLSYRQRLRKCGVFLACEADFMNLTKPPVLTPETLKGIFGRIPPTLTPPAIKEHEFMALKELTRS